MRVLVIIPAYNEQDNILSVIEDVKLKASKVDYIVINDCSTDDTKNILIKEDINHIDLPINLGIGGVMQTGYRYALMNEYDVAIQFDGDGQHMAKYINHLIEPIENGNADIAIGSRFILNKGFQSSWQRRIGINLLRNLIKGLSGMDIRDVTSGFRAVNKQYIEIYAKEYAQDYPEPEALMHAAILKAKILETPVMMRERQGGESSIKAYRSVYYIIKVSLAIILHKIIVRSKKV